MWMCWSDLEGFARFCAFARICGDCMDKCNHGSVGRSAGRSVDGSVGRSVHATSIYANAYFRSAFLWGPIMVKFIVLLTKSIQLNVIYHII